MNATVYCLTERQDLPKRHTVVRIVELKGVRLCVFFKPLTFVRLNCLSPCCLRRGTGGGPRPQNSLEGGGLYLKLHCHHQNDFTIIRTAMKPFQCFVRCEGQSHKTVCEPRLLKEKEIQSVEPNPGCPLTSLTPYHWAKTPHRTSDVL